MVLFEMKNIKKSFGSLEVLKDISLQVEEGEVLSIIGPSGSGKSTLAKMLAGMVEPSGGEVLIDDHPLEFGDYSFRSQRIRRE